MAVVFSCVASCYVVSCIGGEVGEGARAGGGWGSGLAFYTAY